MCAPVNRKQHGIILKTKKIVIGAGNIMNKNTCVLIYNYISQFTYPTVDIPSMRRSTFDQGEKKR